MICRILPSLALLALSACADNVGALWDPDRGGSDDGSGISVVPVGGRLVDARPRVLSADPKGSGWPTTVPIVVVFSESIARDSVEGQSAGGGGGLPGLPTSARVQVRSVETQQTVPTTLSWLVGDRVLVLTPTAGLVADQDYEVVVDPEVRDVDAVRKGGTAPEVVATFRTDRAREVTEGQVVATIPAANERGVEREADVHVIFDRPCDPSTVDDSSFRVEEAGVLVVGARSYPISVGDLEDTRVVRFRAADGLPGSAELAIRFTDAISFLQAGQLDFSNRNPFSTFETVRGRAPERVAVGNVIPGFPDQINAQNFSNLVVDVDVDSSVTAGSEVLVRIYGLDAETEAEDDLAFLEQVAPVPVDGPTTVSVVFGAALGEALRPRFDEGSLAFRATVEVDGRRSGFRATDPGNTPRFDITPPEVTGLTPVLAGTQDLVTDQEALVVLGRASEELGTIEFAAGSNTVAEFGADESGAFMLAPLALQRAVDAIPYSMSFRDRAGNVGTQAIQGRIFQRGFVAGTVGADVTVEVYDDVTFAPVAGALVLLEPDMPQLPAVGRRSGTTGADGRVEFTGLTASRHTITVVADGFDLTTVLDTSASFASLPLRPIDETLGQATLDASLGFLPTGAQSGLVGCNAFADDLVLAQQTAGTPPVAIAGAVLRANRPFILSGVTGVFPPTATPTIQGYACQICGRDGVTPSPASAPLAPGGSAEANLFILPSAAGITSLPGPFELDFGSVAGLGTLASEPSVAVHVTLSGFGRSTLIGAGYATVVSGDRYAMQASLASALAPTLAPLAPVYWVTVDAEGASGGFTRHRTLLSDPRLGSTFPTGVPLGLPVVRSAAGVGSPSISYDDGLDARTLPGGVAFHTIETADAVGRRWSLVRFDSDAFGTDAVQLPELPVGVLQPGAWTVTVDAELMFSGTNRDGNFSLEERRRQQVKFARSAPVEFTVQ